MAVGARARGREVRRTPLGEPAEPLLPLAPSDREKASYADRNIALIIRASLASFGALLISQWLFVSAQPFLLVLAPLLVFTVLYYIISLFVNVGTKGFDYAAHRRLVRS